MKKTLAIFVMSVLPILFTSCAKSPTEPEETGTATQEQVVNKCVAVVPGNVVKVRYITDDDECTCKQIRYEEVDDDNDDDRRRNRHDRGNHYGHYKKHKHKHKDHKKYRKASEKRTWIVEIVPVCGDTAKYTVICSRDGRVIEIRSSAPSCKADLRPADSCITYDQAQTTVTTEKKNAQVEQWEVEQNPATKQWVYYFIVNSEDKQYMYAVDGQNGQIIENKEVKD
ncbi:MAG TPA: hypothetical protein VEC36_02570 [Patescibacteria group bacterium]|nr:hypothetical protein [Patescibacteria group bacterium]